MCVYLPKKLRDSHSSARLAYMLKARTASFQVWFRPDSSRTVWSAFDNNVFKLREKPIKKEKKKNPDQT